MKKIILTGGGTAGHVTPNIALIPEIIFMNQLGIKIIFIEIIIIILVQQMKTGAIIVIKI